MISILLSIESQKGRFSSSIIISGIVVPFLTRSRYVMISALVAFSQLLFSYKFEFRKKIVPIIFIIGSIILLISLSKASGFDIQQVVNERILERDTEMQSARVRITSLYVFLEKYPENPWFGVGPKTRDDVLMLLGGLAPIIHVGYLSYLYYYGVFGCLLFFTALFFILKKAWKIGKTYKFWGSFYGFVSFCLANATFVYFNLSEMGIILGMVYLRYYQEQPIPKIIESEKSVKPRLYPLRKNGESK
jgi:O-antigen ligase